MMMVVFQGPPCFREFREGVVLCCEHRNLAVNRFLGNKRLDREFFHD
jgi:hypothetical protein